jgi:hypothetical protein
MQLNNLVYSIKVKLVSGFYLIASSVGKQGSPAAPVGVVVPVFVDPPVEVFPPVLVLVPVVDVVGEVFAACCAAWNAAFKQP